MIFDFDYPNSDKINCDNCYKSIDGNEIFLIDSYKYCKHCYNKIAVKTVLKDLEKNNIIKAEVEVQDDNDIRR